ncbi:3-phosphoshikimate 1-carboxyvinyltransferase [Lachnospiraceae bacterium PF1-22]
MKFMNVNIEKQTKPLLGEMVVPGDKSISHRSIMLGAIAKGTTSITNFLKGADCIATIDCFRQMGVTIEERNDIITVTGGGLRGLKQPVGILEVGNSGTTTRLLSGILCGQNFKSILSGDASLNKRPMNRIINPLSQMGGDIVSIKKNGCAPLEINAAKLHGIDYLSKVSSAQVKSAVLLAGLYADAPTSVTEKVLSRNHTEIMLKAFGGNVSTEDTYDGTTISVTPADELYASEIDVPGDISSAAYFIAAALLIPGSELLIKNVGINDTRAGFLQAVLKMGGDLTLLNALTSGGEAKADILVRHSKLKGTTIGGKLIPSLIDEIPILAVLAAYAEGETVIKDAAELKVKETNRIDTVCDNLKNMGAFVTPTEDGMIITGKEAGLTGAVIDPKFDHRIAMAFSIAGLIAKGETTIKDGHCVDVSFPEFFTYFKQ